MKYSKKLQEQIILEKLKTSDSGAFTEMYNLYIDRIYRFIYFKVPTHEEAEDLTSEVFLKTWQYLVDQNKEIKSLQALIYQIARNIIIDYYRKRSKVELLNDEEILLKLEDNRQQNLLAKIDIDTNIIRIERAIQALKDEYKEVIILRYIEELSIKEITKIINKSGGAVRVLIHRALTNLRKSLK